MHLAHCQLPWGVRSLCQCSLCVCMRTGVQVYLRVVRQAFVRLRAQRMCNHRHVCALACVRCSGSGRVCGADFGRGFSLETHQAPTE